MREKYRITKYFQGIIDETNILLNLKKYYF